MYAFGVCLFTMTQHPIYKTHAVNICSEKTCKLNDKKGQILKLVNTNQIKPYHVLRFDVRKVGLFGYTP